MTRSPRSGFTLVELIVVIGIIALLVALLLPALNRARQSALKVQCASSMRNIGQYVNIYCMNHSGTMPRLGFSFNVNGTWVGSSNWRREIANSGLISHQDNLSHRTGANARLFCPIERRGSALTYAAIERAVGTNTWSQRPHHNGPGNQPWTSLSAALASVNWSRIGNIRNPSQKVILIEANNNVAQGGLGSGGTDRWALWVHNKGSNFLFADGHVEFHQNPTVTQGFMTTSYLSGGTWNVLTRRN
jgi:prepilin-type processing-associated H-X9-DG protein/prepilin-type N-terminal cleavage/methylation domain-containing protein